MFTYTSEDFKNYLDSNNIPYKKRKDGYPNMSYKNIRLLYDNQIKLKKDEYMKKQNIQCFICYDEMINGVVKLKCGHTLCPSCFAKHMREQGNCPFCRVEICSRPNKIIKMPINMRSAIVDTNISRRIVERDDLDVHNFIKKKIDDFTNSLNLLVPPENRMREFNKKTELRHNIVNEIKEIMKDAIIDTEKYYLSFA
tara:strand:+ start:4798 stop:5388 length:591 start_codon:yes stop_codon:yes gene_type:complete